MSKQSGATRLLLAKRLLVAALVSFAGAVRLVDLACLFASTALMVNHLLFVERMLMLCHILNVASSPVKPNTDSVCSQEIGRDTIDEGFTGGFWWLATRLTPRLGRSRVPSGMLSKRGNF